MYQVPRGDTPGEGDGEGGPDGERDRTGARGPTGTAGGTGGTPTAGTGVRPGEHNNHPDGPVGSEYSPLVMFNHTPT